MRREKSEGEYFKAFHSFSYINRECIGNLFFSFSSSYINIEIKHDSCVLFIFLVLFKRKGGEIECDDSKTHSLRKCVGRKTLCKNHLNQCLLTFSLFFHQICEADKERLTNDSSAKK